MQNINLHILDALELSKTIPAEHRTFVGLYLLVQRLGQMDEYFKINGMADEKNGVLVQIRDAINDISFAANIEEHI